VVICVMVGLDDGLGVGDVVGEVGDELGDLLGLADGDPDGEPVGPKVLPVQTRQAEHESTSTQSSNIALRPSQRSKPKRISTLRAVAALQYLLSLDTTEPTYTLLAGHS